MKKLFIAALALVSLAACSKSEVIEEIPQKAISFNSPFVDNSTKAIDPSYSSTNLPGSFYVYGMLTNSYGTDNAEQTINIFNKESVSKTNYRDGIGQPGDATYKYDKANVQYWIPNNTYRFAAVACDENADITNSTNAATPNMPASIAYTATGSNDLLFAIDGPTLFNNQTGFDTNVDFTFNHLLSKVVFKFTNSYVSEDFVIEVSNVKIIGANNVGTREITYTTKSDNSDSWSYGGNWTFGSGTKDFEFGNAVASDASETGTTPKQITNGSDYALSNNECLLIPGIYKDMKISFLANVYLKQEDTYTKVDEFDYTTTYITATEDITLAEGCSYCFIIDIAKTLNPITFSINSVTGWDSDLNSNSTEDYDITISYN